jgi:hypothetical protein
MIGLYLADIIILVAGPIALDKIKWKFFLVLIVPTALHIVFVYFMCPETKGRSLEDINAQFGETVAVKWYGATEEEKRELEVEAEQDEKMEQIARNHGVVSQVEEVNIDASAANKMA